MGVGGAIESNFLHPWAEESQTFLVSSNGSSISQRVDRGVAKTEGSKNKTITSTVTVEDYLYVA
jgi:hypothetical protein